MRYLGIDFGTKRIGVAISDPAGSMAFPREVILNDKKALDVLAALVESERIECVVAGDTGALGERGNVITNQADAFLAALTSRTGLRVERVREAWSSQEAARFAPKGKKHDDSSAAAIILQRYLDMHPGSVQ